MEAMCVNDERIRGYIQNSPPYSESHIIREVLDIGALRELYLRSLFLGRVIGMDRIEYASDGPEAQRIAQTIPYYPFKGIERFYDIGGMCADPEAFALAVKVFTDRYRGMGIDSIGGFDARGFILGPPVALALNIPFFMLRKKGKMPNAIDGAAYSKEYKGDDSAGKDALCVQRSAAAPGKRVVLVDDLVATGGTLLAGVDLVKGLGAEVVECACMIELKALDGVGKLHEHHPDVPVWSLISEDILTVEGKEGT